MEISLLVVVGIDRHLDVVEVVEIHWHDIHHVGVHIRHLVVVHL